MEEEYDDDGKQDGLMEMYDVIEEEEKQGTGGEVTMQII